jgi:hypothetical protein
LEATAHRVRQSCSFEVGEVIKTQGSVIVARLNTLADAIDRDRIVERLREVTPHSSHRWGRMTSHEMVCHLADAFRIALGERKVKPGDNVFHRTALKWMALYSPTPWPRGVSTRPEADPRRAGTPPDSFSRDVREVESLLARFLDRIAMGTLDRHPLFGPMSSWQWLRWGYLHMDHHLRQFGA